MIRPLYFKTIQPTKVSDLQPHERIFLGNDVDSDARELSAGILQVSGYGRLPIETSDLGIQLRVPKLVFESIAQECAGVGSESPQARR